jgi:hypothetical protein
MDNEPIHDLGARDTGTSKTEGRLKLMLSKRHAKKLKNGKGGPGYYGKGGPKLKGKDVEEAGEDPKEEAKESKKEEKAEEKIEKKTGKYDGKGGPGVNMAKFGSEDAAMKFKKSDNLGKIQ